MEKRAPMSVGQLLAFLVLLPLVIAWAMERISIVVQVAP
jgi:hypothetical protein